MYVLVYDSYCGPCTRFRNAIDFLDTKERIDFVGLVKADRDGFLDSIPAAKRHRSFHLIAPDGTVASGAAALPPLIGVLPAGRALGRIMELSLPVMFATKLVYSTFSRLHDSGSCAYSPGPASTSISTSIGCQRQPSKGSGEGERDDDGSNPPSRWKEVGLVGQEPTS